MPRKHHGDPLRHDEHGGDGRALLGDQILRHGDHLRPVAAQARLDLRPTATGRDRLAGPGPSPAAATAAPRTASRCRAIVSKAGCPTTPAMLRRSSSRMSGRCGRAPGRRPGWSVEEVVLLEAPGLLDLEGVVDGGLHEGHLGHDPRDDRDGDDRPAPAWQENHSRKPRVRRRRIETPRRPPRAGAPRSMRVSSDGQGRGESASSGSPPLSDQGGSTGCGRRLRASA